VYSLHTFCRIYRQNGSLRRFAIVTGVYIENFSDELGEEVSKIIKK
jgi:hypothetical protein